MTWIQTYDGAAFDILEPEPGTINPNTIAVGLSRMARFAGHSEETYSVGQHSLMVCELVQDPRLKIPALLHDAHEIYWGFGDICRPAKSCISSKFREELVRLQQTVDRAIAARFGFDFRLFYHPEVKHADCVALFAEQRDLMKPAPRPWSEQVDCSHVEIIRPRDSEAVAKDFLNVLKRMRERHEVPA